MHENSSQTTPEPAAAPQPARRIKFDRWLFDYDIDNTEAAKQLDVHPLSIGRWRKKFDDPMRRIPPQKIIRAVEHLSDGVVRFEDWDRPCDVAYLTPASDGAGQ